MGFFTSYCRDRFFQLFLAAALLAVSTPISLADEQSSVSKSESSISSFQSARVQAKSFTKSNSDLPSNLVNTVFPAADGGLWVGTKSGLARFSDGQWRVFTEKDGLPAKSVTAVIEALDGTDTLWVVAPPGLASKRKGSEVFKPETIGGPGVVQSVAATRDGDIWVVTASEGTSADTKFVHVNRLHDGQWQVFDAHADIGMKRLLVFDSSRVTPTKLQVATNGDVWMINFHGGVARRREGSWKVFSVEDLSSETAPEWNPGGSWSGSWWVPRGRPKNDPPFTLTSMTLAANGDVWVGTQVGLALYQNEQWKVFTPDNSSLPCRLVYEVTTTPNGDVWAHTAEGLVRYSQGKFHLFPNDSVGIPSTIYPRAVAGSLDGSLWLGTYSHGIIRICPSPWEMFKVGDSGLPSIPIKAMASDRDGSVWMIVDSDESGLIRYEGGKWLRFTRENSGLPQNRVHGLTCTRDGSVWVFSDGGLVRFRNGDWHTFTERDCKPLRYRFGFLGDTPDGALWVGTQGGLAKYQEGKWEALGPENSNLPFHVDRVEALTVSPDGVLWALFSDYGEADTAHLYHHFRTLARLKDGKWNVFAKQEDPHDIMGSLRSIAATTKEEVWVGLFNYALWRFHPGEWQYFDPFRTGDSYGVKDLKMDLKGALWAATNSGLVRYHEGEWQTFTQQSCDIPDENLTALTVGSDGSIWIGTHSGSLIRFQPPSELELPRLVELIPKNPGNGKPLTDLQHTFAARAFDPGYRTDPQMFRYLWTVSERKDGKADEKDVETATPFFSSEFQDDHRYVLSVRAIDRYGYRSEPKSVDFKIEVPKTLPKDQWLLTAAKVIVPFVLAYLIFLPLLILLYDSSSLARTVVSSPVFNKFPIVYKIILNSTWARRCLYRKGAQMYLASLEIPSPYIPQAVYPLDGPPGESITLESKQDFLSRLCVSMPQVLLLGRSGTGKSVLLRYLLQLALNDFLNGTSSELPLLIDLRTHPLAGRQMEDLIVDELKGHELRDLPEDMLKFWTRKGGLLLLVDSLNEVGSKVIKNEFQAYLNRDRHNRIVMASQLDLLERRETHVFRLAEVDAAQARQYLKEVTGRDLWDQLPLEVQGLARNPQNLRLLGEMRIERPQDVPKNRAALYAHLLSQDTALSSWLKTGSPEIWTIYHLAFMMVDESRKVLSEDDLAAWVLRASDQKVGASPDMVAVVIQGMQRSRMFQQEVERLPLGMSRPVWAFTHELLAKFLASRHIRSLLETIEPTGYDEIVALAGEPRWLEVFFFVIDELSSRRPLNQLLSELAEKGGPLRQRIVAYGLGTSSEEMIDREIWEAYSKSKVLADLRGTPAIASSDLECGTG
jgi:ligand-binding sensor domain-containing protein